MLSFKDFLVVDYTPEMPEEISYAAKKRKRGVVGEALTLKGRRALARALKRNKAKVKVGRRRAMQRTANPEVLMKRARKHARNQLFQKLAKDTPKDEMSPQRKAEIEKRLDKMKGRVDKIARRILPQVRKIEKERRFSKKDKDAE